MARPLLCDECQTADAAVMLSMLDSGETLALCAQHWGGYVVQMVSAIDPGSLTEILGALMAAMPDEAVTDAEAVAHVEVTTDAAPGAVADDKAQPVSPAPRKRAHKAAATKN